MPKNPQIPSMGLGSTVVNLAREFFKIGSRNIADMAATLQQSSDPNERKAAAARLSGKKDHVAVLALTEAIKSDDVSLSDAARASLNNSLLISQRGGDTGAFGHVVESLVTFLQSASVEQFRSQRLNAAEMIGLCADSAQKARDYILKEMLFDSAADPDELRFALQPIALRPAVSNELKRLLREDALAGPTREVVCLLLGKAQAAA